MKTNSKLIFDSYYALTSATPLYQKWWMCDETIFRILYTIYPSLKKTFNFDCKGLNHALSDKASLCTSQNPHGLYMAKFSTVCPYSGDARRIKCISCQWLLACLLVQCLFIHSLLVNHHLFVCSSFIHSFIHSFIISSFINHSFSFICWSLIHSSFAHSLLGGLFKYPYFIEIAICEPIAKKVPFQSMVK